MALLKVPLLAIGPRSVSTGVTFWAWGVAVELDDEFDDEPRSTCYLIKRQRKLGESPRPIDRLRAMVLGGALSDRLNGLATALPSRLTRLRTEIRRDTARS